MNSADIDWKILRGALIVFVLAITVSGSLVWGGIYFRDSMQTEFIRANASFRTISGRYLAVDEEEKLIRSYLPRFMQMYERGVIGNEQRLNWVEVLREAGDEFRVPGVSYQIETQQVYTPEFSLDLGKFRLYSSKMSLTMQLLHEGDLFRVLDRLKRDARGIFTVVSCGIAPSVREIGDNPEVSNISARCDLNWYTIRLADGTAIEV